MNFCNYLMGHNLELWSNRGRLRLVTYSTVTKLTSMSSPWVCSIRPLEDSSMDTKHFRWTFCVMTTLRTTQIYKHQTMTTTKTKWNETKPNTNKIILYFCQNNSPVFILGDENCQKLGKNRYFTRGKFIIGRNYY